MNAAVFSLLFPLVSLGLPLSSFGGAGRFVTWMAPRPGFGKQILESFPLVRRGWFERYMGIRNFSLAEDFIFTFPHHNFFFVARE